MPRYKVGDIAVVRQDIKYGERYYMDDMITVDVATKSMCKLAGKAVTIKRIWNPGSGTEYKIEEDDCWWTDDMFISEPDFEESDMPIENLLGVAHGR